MAAQTFTMALNKSLFRAKTRGMCIARHSTVRKFWWREIATLFKTWINGCSNPRDIKRRAEGQVEAVSAPLDQILLKAWLNLKSSGNWRESTRPWSRRGWDEWMNEWLWLLFGRFCLKLANLSQSIRSNVGRAPAVLTHRVSLGTKACHFHFSSRYFELMVNALCN